MILRRLLRWFRPSQENPFDEHTRMWLDGGQERNPSAPRPPRATGDGPPPAPPGPRQRSAHIDGCSHYVRTNAPGFPCEDCGERIDGLDGAGTLDS